MGKWKKETYRLRRDHQWKARPGYQILVLDRGAVRFEFPQGWHFAPGADSLKLHDQEPPDDNCRLQVSVMYLSAGIDWSALPLPRLLEEAIGTDIRGLISRGQIVQERRPDLELAWTENRFIDPVEQREACTRACLARGSNIQPFITMDYWPEHAERFVRIWEDVLRTLRLGKYVKDPTRGTLR